MSDLIFMMGEFEAVFPTDRLYVDNHMWAQPSGDNRFRFGFTAYAVRLLQDVYFLDWVVEAPTNLTHRQEIGAIESKKAESALYAPCAGELVQFNDQLMSDPSAINVDKYEGGWLFEMNCDQPEFSSVIQHIDWLDEVWEKTQRTIKGQLNS